MYYSKLFLLLSLITFVSCATKVTGLQQDETFTYESIQTGKIAVGAIVNGQDKIDRKQSISISNLLASNIVEQRNGVNVTSVGNTINTLGEKKYNGLVTDFETTGSLSQDSLDLLSSKIKNNRYVVFSRIESDITTQNKDEKEIVDSNNKPTGEGKNITMTVKRNLRVALSVYDLQLKKLVWSGSIDKTGNASNQYTYKYPVQHKGVLGAIQMLTAKDEKTPDYQYPAAPELQTILGQVFRGFAENLPEKK